MPTNLNINDSLLEKAVILGKHKSKREAVNSALEEYIRLHKQMEIKDLFNKIDYDSKYKYKRQRAKK
jgi:Arc/MetJ family transcription regulator